MSINSLFLSAIKKRWTVLVENPEGFPNTPPEHNCWLWGGYMAPGTKLGPPRPRAKLLGQPVNPRNILYELYTGKTSRLKTKCGCHNCINPRHAVETSELDNPSPFEPKISIDSWIETLKSIPDLNHLAAEDIAATTGAPLEAAQRFLDEMV
jgi:hypothetical protein